MAIDYVFPLLMAFCAGWLVRDLMAPLYTTKDCDP